MLPMINRVSLTIVGEIPVVPTHLTVYFTGMSIRCLSDEPAPCNAEVRGPERKTTATQSRIKLNQAQFDYLESFLDANFVSE